MTPIESTKWLKSYLERKTREKIDMNSEAFQVVKDFALIWNIFESTCCNKHCTPDIMWRGRAINTSEKIVIQTFTFFKERYIDNDDVNERFNSLNIKNHKDEIKKILLDIAPDIEDQAKACRIIIQRLRNNMFHGEKDVTKLSEQYKLLELANTFLTDTIDNINKP